jgi:hypothetical protein
MPSGFWKKRDAIVCDTQRLDIIGKRLFAWPIKDTDLVTYKEAKLLAMAMLKDSDYREWRSAELSRKS